MDKVLKAYCISTAIIGGPLGAYTNITMSKWESNLIKKEYRKRDFALDGLVGFCAGAITGPVLVPYVGYVCTKRK